MNWRIYRLPGSREIWHIDAGPGTLIFNVHGYKCAVDTESVDIASLPNYAGQMPRAWIQLVGELHIVNGIALFSGGGNWQNVPQKDAAVPQVSQCAAAQE